MDVKIVTRIFSGSDHFVVLPKVRIITKWEFGTNMKVKVCKELARKYNYSGTLVYNRLGLSPT